MHSNAIKAINAGSREIRQPNGSAIIAALIESEIFN